MSVPNSKSALQGWRLLSLLSLGLLALTGVVLALQPDVAGVRLVIRLTARTSLALFLLAFTAGAAARQWPGPWTHWQLRNRRYLGLGFAASHTIHLAAIAAFASLDPAAFHGASSMGNFITGGLAYLFIAAMSATSFDAAVAWLGPKTWGWLHRAGVHYLWLSFLFSFGRRIPMSPGYALPVVLLLLAMGLRLWPRRNSVASGVVKARPQP
jgi:DMSO/TMAO reductase YedYZ heme-binding membrane subunit